MKRIFQYLAQVVLIANLVSACSQGSLQSQNEKDADSNNGQSAPTTNPPHAPDPAALKAVDLKGYIDGGDFDRVKSIDLDKTNGDLIISMPLGMDASVIVTQGTVPDLPGASFYTNFGSDGRAYFVVRVPVRYFLRNVLTTTPSRLPNGDALPIQGLDGELPSIVFALSSNPKDTRKVYLYLNAQVVAVFVESKWLACPPDFPICLGQLGYNIKNESKTKVIAVLRLIMAKNAKDGGFFIGARIPTDIAKILDNYFIR
jgi:hypothetical protein